MGTRGFVGFVAAEREVITYCQFDAYPSGLGASTLEWLRSANLDIAAKVAPDVRAVGDDVPPTAEDIAALKASYDGEVDRERSDATGSPTWYQLLRRTQGDLGAILRAGYALADPTFPRDSLFCEYGYLVNFDAKRFEAYEGFQKVPHAAGRFADRAPVREGYWPVRLVASWPFDALPSEDGLSGAYDRDDAGTEATS